MMWKMMMILIMMVMMLYLVLFLLLLRCAPMTTSRPLQDHYGFLDERHALVSRLPNRIRLELATSWLHTMHHHHYYSRRRRRHSRALLGLHLEHSLATASSSHPMLHPLDHSQEYQEHHVEQAH
jgi:hypothetical protein